MYHHVNPKNGEKAPLIDDKVYEVIMVRCWAPRSAVARHARGARQTCRPTPRRAQANAERLDSEIVYDRDFDYDYFGFKTLERSYLLRVNGKVVERPQHMLMRVAVGIHGEDIEAGA